MMAILHTEIFRPIITVLAASHVDTATNGRTLGPTIYSYNRHSVYNVVDNY
jgi:hypothetical protein